MAIEVGMKQLPSVSDGTGSRKRAAPITTPLLIDQATKILENALRGEGMLD
jgi:hypothetical protein